MNSHLIICKEKHKKDNEETDEKILLYNKVEQLKNENNKLKESNDNKQESKEIIYEKSESVKEIFKKNHSKIEQLIDIIELDEYKYDDIDVITVTLCKNGKKIMKDKLDQDRSTFELLNLKDEIVIFPMILKEKSKKIIAKEVQPLVINDYSLVYRKEDGYVDVTNLCKAGGKKYNHWNSLEKTQDFIKVVSMSVGIPTDLLIQNEDRRTWVHPQVAINIAQWISPEFDVQVLKWINNIKKESESTKDLTQIKEYKFGTSDLVVPIRADGMINATALCKAANKKLNDYTRLKTTQEYLKVLEINTGIPVLELLNLDVGGNHNGTWIHRKVGYHLAQWLSPGFAVQVSNILDELFITGKVEHGNQKTNEELESKYKEKITSLIEKLETNKQELETIKTNYQTLSLKNNSLMKRHHYVKFKESDPCFYIIDSGILCDCGQPNTQYKFGIAGTDQQHTIDNRLQSHRTLWPLLKVRFILFIKDVSVIEKTFKMMYEKEINPNGHEIIEGVLLENMIERLKKLFDLLCIKDYHIMSDEKIKEYNDYVDSTIKTKD